MPEGLAEAGPDADLRLIAGAVPTEESAQQSVPLKPDFSVIDTLLAVLEQVRRG